jgi:tRNA(Ser,Leu) C12 N-acetylase TAN1
MRNEVLKVHPKDPEQVISTGFQTVTTNKTFESMNVKDAKWMLGYIDQLTESQIRNALRVSGYDQAEEDAIYLKLMLRKENIRQVIEQVYSNMNAKKIKAN